MLADFDFLYGKLDSVNTHFPIVKQVTGADILSDVRKVRTSIDTVTCDAGFYDCLYRAITLCKNMHISFTDGYPYNDYDASYITEAKRNTISFFRSSTYRKYDIKIEPFQVYYVDGEYFVPNIYESDFTYKVQIPEKSKLLKINDITIDEYVEKWMTPISERVKWDVKNRKYYVGSLLSPQRVGQSDKFKVTYLYQNKIHEIDLVSHKIKYANTYGGYTPKVLYFAKDKILYVRVPQMDRKNINAYTQALIKYKDYEIKKVIIDVRGNGGGSDMVWRNILSTIIANPIPLPQKLIFRDNKLVKEYMSKDNIKYTTDDIYKKPITIGENTNFALIGNGSINPAKNTLNYNGKIYVLMDDNVFSSTLVLVSVSQNSDQLITVGSPCGYFGGQGVSPIYFIMPNTKFIFRIEYSLDGTSVDENNLEDYYHNKPEIFVNQTLDDIFKTRNSGLELYDEDFLYNIDPVFRKVLEQPLK